MEDEIQYLPQGYLSYFDVTDELFPWQDSVVQEIERRRAALNDMLLFDILLSLGGIRQPDTFYPPRDVRSLERLLDAISASQYDILKKTWHEDGRETKFEQARSIPPQFCALSDAYWHLDAGLNVQRAVALLSDSRLNRDYASKIIHALSLSENPTTLILKYVRTAKPLLTEPEDMKLYTLALADSNFFEAWQYQRSFNESDEMRPRLFNALLEWCITPSPRSAALSQLLGLPLSSFEQSILHTYALQPPLNLTPSAIAALQDLICVRLIESGNYAEAIKMDRQFSSISTLKGHHITQERRKMIQEIYASLPQVERTVLDLELEAQDAASTSFMGSSSHNNGGDVSMTNSWEDIRPAYLMPTSVNGKASPIQPPTLDRSTGFRAAPSGSTIFQMVPHLHKHYILPPSIPLSSSTSSTLHQSLNRSQQSIPSTSTPSIPFESAAKRQNAFFQPQDRRKSAGQEFNVTNGNGQQSFSESLFGITPSVPEPKSNGRPPTVNNTSKMPPGAFGDPHADEEVHHEIPAQPMRMGTRHRAVKVRDANLKRSIPGALMDETDDSEEEEDEIAPLRSPSPPRRALRKGRASTTEARGAAEQSRRRSSRLSSVPHPDPVPSLKKTAKSRKSAATTTTTTTKAKRKR
ncbi:nuclear pore complex assembly-domain-containing protein [Armillaria borealis]|uniref:Nuclear pore complex assembly-domain-containing protein n=1 Tax=Armillaria borealis TaxID=47425 RepID=A0AA39J2X6_9AGAR|nr:nuclear pore complex assembly-domain-containing protein [Armillaria borealis]